MDERRRTISSEEQMIGEALMRVSNTLEAQRLTKSLDYQEKLRSRSNIRLIIAIICLFVALMMMVISGSLLFVLWRYADPVLDTVVPFLKNMMGDFGVIWDGLVESLSYVPVMVEQLTRLLEQVIIMLEGINKIDLAGMMNYLSQMLGMLVGMMKGLDNAMSEIMPLLQDMMQGLADGGISGLLEAMGIDPTAIEALMDGTMELLKSLGGMLSVTGTLVTEEVLPALAAIDLDPDDVKNLVNSIGGAMQNITNSINENVTQSDIDKLVQGGGKLVSGLGDALDKVGQGLEDIDPQDVKDVIAGGGELLQGLSKALSEIGGMLSNITISTEGGLWDILKLLGIGFG